jgi:hypothetical protein
MRKCSIRLWHPAADLSLSAFADWFGNRRRARPGEQSPQTRPAVAIAKRNGNAWLAAAPGGGSIKTAPACSLYGQVTPDKMRLPAVPHLSCGSDAVLPEKIENALGPAAARPFRETQFNLPTFRGSDQA